MRRRPEYLSLGLLLLLLATPQRASAYVDPGSGAMIWQVLAAGFLGVLFYLRKSMGFIQRAVRIFFRPAPDRNSYPVHNPSSTES